MSNDEPLLDDPHALGLIETLIREGLRPLTRYVEAKVIDERAGALATVIARELDVYQGTTEERI